MLEALQVLDGGILLWIQEHLRQETLDQLVSVYTDLGEGGVLWILIALALILFPRTRKAGLLSLVAMLAGYLFNDILVKNLIQRPRPFLAVEGLTTVIPPPDSYSFPSGHSCSSLAAAMVWFRTLEGRWAAWGKGLLLAMAALMALSRLYVGVHYPTDVLTGSLVGLAVGWLTCRYLGPLYDRRLGRRKTE